MKNVSDLLNQQVTSSLWLQNQDEFDQRADGENLHCALLIYHFMREKGLVLNFMLCEFHLELGFFSFSEKRMNKDQNR